MSTPPAPRRFDPSSDLGRRAFLARAAGASGAFLLPGLAEPLQARGSVLAAAPDLIRDENRKPGAHDWQLTRVRVDKDGFRSPWIEGYCSKQSVKAGESIALMVSTEPARRFRVEI